MSEFSVLTTKLITPLLKRRGFKKHGAFNRSPTSDRAIYRRGDIALELKFAFHPYDYPYVGIRMLVRRRRDTFDRLHPPTEGGVEAMLRAVITDIESAAGGV